jgi:hypothetical protein
MKQFIIFFICSIGVIQIQAQTLSFRGDELTVLNTSVNTQKFLLKNIRTGIIEEQMYLLPGASKSFELKNNRKSVRRHRLYSVYDEMCYFYDLELIKIELEQLQKQRRNAIIGEALLRAFDQFFLKGRIGRVIDVVTLFNDVVNNDYDNFVRNFERTLTESKVIGAIDGRVAKSLASASFSLQKLAQEERYPGIEKKISNNINKLKHSSYVEINLEKTLNKYIRNEFHISASLPVSQSYKFDGIKDKTGAYSDYGIPYNIRLVNAWNKINDFGIFVSAAYGLSPVLVDHGLSYNTADAGVGISTGDRSYGFIELGVRNFFSNTYYYPSYRDNETGEIRDFASFKYYKSKPYINIGLSISIKYINIFGYYSFSGKKDDLWTSQVQMGLSVPLIRKYRYY